MSSEYATTESCLRCGKATLQVRWVDIETDQAVVPKRLDERCTNPECETHHPNETAFDVVRRATDDD